jgi:hypothetical protein
MIRWCTAFSGPDRNKKTEDGRGGGIRTHDPLRPRQVRYQTALRPDPFFGGQAIAELFVKAQASSSLMQ